MNAMNGMNEMSDMNPRNEMNQRKKATKISMQNEYMQAGMHEPMRRDVRV